MSPSQCLSIAAALVFSMPALAQEAAPRPADEHPGAQAGTTRPAPPAVALGRQEEALEPPPPTTRAGTTAPAGESLFTAVAGLACWAMAAVVLIFGARMFFRRAMEKGESTSEDSAAELLPAPAEQTPTTRLGDEGFWIDGGGGCAGTRVLCRYFAEGSERQVEITLDAREGGQFVYTGSRPLSVSLLILAPRMDADEPREE
jgi:hypothetical protein